MKEYLYDYEKSLEEYKGCQETTLKLAKKNAKNAIKQIESLDEAYKKDIIYDIDNNIPIGETEKPELDEIIRKYNSRVNKLKRRHHNFEKQINSIKLKLEKDLELAIQNQTEKDQNKEEKEDNSHMSANMQRYRINTPNEARASDYKYSTKNEARQSDNKEITFTDISSPKIYDHNKSNDSDLKHHIKKRTNTK